MSDTSFDCSFVWLDNNRICTVSVGPKSSELRGMRIIIGQALGM